MNWNRLTNKVRKDLYNYQSQEDGGDIWDAIEANVDTINSHNRKGGQRRFIIFFVLLLGASFLTYSLLQNKSIHAKIADPQLTQNIENHEFKQHQTAANTSNAIAHTSPHTIEINDTPIKNDIINTRVQVSKNLNATKKITNLYEEENTNYNNIVSAAKTKEVRRISPNHTYANHSNQQKYTTVSNLLKTTSKSKQSDLVGISKMNYLLLKNFPNDFSQELPSKQFIPYEENSDDEINKKKNSRLSFGFDFGYIHTTKQLTENQSDVQDFIDLRNETENTLEAIHASLTGEYAINSKLSIVSGIDYTRINESFRFLEIDEVTSTEVGEKFVLIGDGVNPTNFNLRGEIDVSEISITDYQLYNRYELIDIPFLLSYKWTKNKWSYGVQAGVVANVQLNGKGRILDTIQKSDDIENINHLKSNLGLSFSLHGILEYHLKPAFSVVFLPNVRFFPNDFSREDYQLKERYQFIGTDIGFRYYLHTK